MRARNVISVLCAWQACGGAAMADGGAAGGCDSAIGSSVGAGAYEAAAAISEETVFACCAEHAVAAPRPGGFARWAAAGSTARRARAHEECRRRHQDGSS